MKVDVPGRIRQAARRDLPTSAWNDFVWVDGVLASAGMSAGLRRLLAYEAALGSAGMPAPCSWVWLAMLGSVQVAPLDRLRETLALALDARQLADDRRPVGEPGPTPAEAIDTFLREAGLIRGLAATVSDRIRKTAAAKR